MPVDGDGGQREHRHVDSEDLNERTEGAHEEGQIPALQKSRLKLKVIGNKETRR